MRNVAAGIERKSWWAVMRVGADKRRIMTRDKRIMARNWRVMTRENEILA